jgi:hypothetical protein
MIGIGEVLAGLNILERLGKFWNWFRTRRKPPVESVATRLVRLFESHGVRRNQIPRFINHGLTLKDVQDDASLLPKLDEMFVAAVCERFAVRREWLDGVESQIHPCLDFYKNPESCGFRSMPVHDSGACRSTVPVDAGPRFRRMSGQ